MKIEILGSGCAKCKKLYENTLEAVKLSGINAEVVKIEDMQIIVSKGIMRTPALVVDGKVKTTGVLLTPEDIKKILA